MYFTLTNCSFIDIIGLDIKGNHPEGWDWAGIALTDSNNINIQNCTVKNTDYYIGVALQRVSYCSVKDTTVAFGGIGISIREGSSYNIIERCTAMFNDLWGGDSDGINIAYDGNAKDSTYNIIKNCKSFNNSDDGIDTWISNYNIVSGNISCRNGYDRYGVPSGDGNGFKLGGNGSYNSTGGNNLAVNNIAFSNLANGFDQNGGSAPVYMYSNTAYKNGARGITMGTKGIVYVRNNISFLNKIDDLEDSSNKFVAYDNFISNPGFVNVENEDFHLKFSSPLKGKGKLCSISELDKGFLNSKSQNFNNEIKYSFTQDKDGVKRPNEKITEPGAFEYSSLTKPLTKTVVIPFLKPTPAPTVTPTPETIVFEDEVIDPDFNLIKNSGLENGNELWTDWGNFKVVSNDTYKGINAIRVGTSQGGCAQEITTGFNVGEMYTFSFKGKMDNDRAIGYGGIICYNLSDTEILKVNAPSVTGKTYKKYSIDFKIPEGTVKIVSFLWKDNSPSAYFYADEFILMNIKNKL